MAEENALVKRIASVVGHELRNPLAVISNSAYFIKTKLGQDGKLDPKVEKHLGIMTAEIGRVDKMIGDIHRVSKPVEPVLRKQALRPIVEAALAALQLPDKIKVKKEFPKTEVEAEADEALLRDALKRLLDNAVEAMGESGTLTVTLSTVKKEACIAVKDAGPGVKPEFMALLFEPFATTKPRNLGLGLSTAKKIAAAHKGRVEGKSTPAGCVFSLYLPQ